MSISDSASSRKGFGGVPDKSKNPSLDKVRSNWSDLDFEPAVRVKANDKFSYKISYKSKEAKNIRVQIRSFLKDQVGIELPVQYEEFRSNKESILEGFEEFEELAKATYKINTHAVYGVFQEGKEVGSQIIACKYSRHRLDPVWNYRKSQLIRKVWRNYLVETGVHRKYRPCHLVLTVPRNEKQFMNQQFYAKLLVKCFNALRKRKAWSENIKGGEYGVEVSKGRNSDRNGLHIHIHSLCFVDWEADLKELRKELKKAWKRVCKVDADENIFLHLETVYYFDKEEKERFDKVVGISESQDEYGNYQYVAETEETTRRKKVYVTKESDDDCYLKAIMECIKYHFKSDCLYVKGSNDKPLKNKAGYPIVDVPLVHDILVNSKGLRFYSKFGFCYKEEKLNYERKVESPETDYEPSMEESEDKEVQLGDLEKSANNLVNPFTKEPAKEGEYKLYLALPSNIKHNPKSDLFEPMKPKIRGLSDMFECDISVDAKEIMKGLAKQEYRDILTYEAYEIFLESGGFTFTYEKQLANSMLCEL